MNTKSIKLIALAIPAILAGCNDDKFTPGPETPSSSPGIYFDAETEPCYILPSDADPQITLTLGRREPGAELTIPLEILDPGQNLTFPQSVTFPAGSQTTEITVKGKNLESGKKYWFTLGIPSDLTRPYADDVPGTSTVTSYIVLVDPLMAICTFETFSSTVGGDFEVEMMPISDTEYLFRDFFGSGQPLTVKIDKSTNDVSISSPLGEYDSEYSDFCIYEPLYPGGDKAGSYITTLFIYYPGYSYYYDDEAGEGICLSCYLYFADGTSNYEYIYLQFPQ